MSGRPPRSHPRRKPSQAHQEPSQAPKKKRRRNQGPPQEGKPQKPQMPKFVDIHLRVGLEDELIRLSPPHWFKLLNLWMLAGEDVIVRVQKKEFEMNIVLRGGTNGCVTVRPPDRRKLPVGMVLSTSEIQEKMLQDAGI